MNTLRFETTRYGYKAEIGGVIWQLRRMTDGSTFAVYTTDETFADMPNFYGDILDARRFLNGIAADFADSVGL